MTPEDRATLISLLEQVVTASEIAAMAGVSRPQIANWMVRYPDTFPKAVASVQDYRLYDTGEVEAWIAHHFATRKNAGPGTGTPAHIRRQRNRDRRNETP